jgi:GTP cyclohydrolase I
LDSEGRRLRNDVFLREAGCGTSRVRAELEWGRPKVEVAKSVVPVLLEGLDETVKQNGIFSTMRIVAETLEKMIEGTFRIPMDEIISQTVADRREQEQEHEMVRGYSSQLGK